MKTGFRSSRRSIALGVSLLVLAGCSGYSAPSGQGSDVDLTYNVAPQASSTTAGSAKGDIRGKVRPGAPVGSSGTALPSRVAAQVPGTVSSPPPVGGWPVADLFSAADDTMGLHEDKLVLCFHAPLSWGHVLGFDEQDFSVYWDMVNDQQGGIFGRKVEMHVFDDLNRPDRAVEAAESCRAEEPFLMLSGGAEATPAVREWAEQRHMFYLPGLATEVGTEHLRYSFSRVASVERLCRVLARRVLEEYRGLDIAVVYRNNSSWIGGRDAFKEVLNRAGIRLVADIPLDDSTQTYYAQIDELKDAGADVVLMQDTTVRWVAMMRQAAAQDFRPQWMSWSGVALAGDVGGDSALGAESAWPLVPYLPDDRVPWAEEMNRMERAYERYATEIKTPNEFGWLFWILGRDLHRMLLDCGRDCTRNKLAGMMLGGYEGGTRWMCQPRGDLGRWSGFSANLLKLRPRGSASRWVLLDSCRSGL